VLWLAVKLPARRFEFSVLQLDGEVCGTLSPPVAKTPIAPAAITLTSIAISLVFTLSPCLDHELTVFNRLVTGHCNLVHQAGQKVRILRRDIHENEDAPILLSGRDPSLAH